MGGRRLAEAVTAADASGGFELEYCPSAGLARRAGLMACAGEPFEDALPVRPFHFEKGQSSFAGWWWLATTSRHVGCESLLERDHLMMLDFDPVIASVASQPFWLRWRDADGRPRRHVPDFFARCRDGRGVVVDVRPDDRIPERDAQAFAATGRACAVAGWGYRRVGALDPVLVANVRWLSRYRHRRCGGPADMAASLAEVFGAGRPLFAGAALAGDRLAVLPVVFHLMWRGDLVADLTARPLGTATLVRAAGR
jgi:hypothetical protein